MSAVSPIFAEPGDKAPPFYGMLEDGRFFSSEDQAGRPVVLILVGRLAPVAVAPLIDAFADRARLFEAEGADLRVLASASLQWMTPSREAPSILHCPSEEVFDRVGFVGGRPLVLVLDRSLRILARLENEAPEVMARAALERLAALPHGEPRRIAAPAPVLIVPDLIDAGFRRTLIAHFEQGRQVEGAMASVDAQGVAVSRIDTEKKQRRDCTLDPSGELHAAVLDVLDRRLSPEIARAFQAEIAHIDRVLIARYDDTGGYFRRHRDNGAPAVAFRQFALSLNLNTDEYDGGELCFPEFNDHLYSPPAGAACVFSASLLHEARPVTRGRRYVLLTFLHDQAAEARRQAHLLAGAMRAA